MDWYTYWNNFQEIIPADNLLAQVGKTINGQPVSDDQIDLITESIINSLGVSREDQVVDLCCGNGLLTRNISKKCQAITGVDYSGLLIDTAKKYNAEDNINYLNRSILDLVPSDVGRTINKFYMYEALQHFRVSDLKSILDMISSLSGGHALLLLASIPDKSRRFKFYNTFSRRLEWFKRTLMNKEAIGTWWRKEKLSAICNEMGCCCEILDQDTNLYTAHYRFNVLIEINR